MGWILPGVSGYCLASVGLFFASPIFPWKESGQAVSYSIADIVYGWMCCGLFLGCSSCTSLFPKPWYGIGPRHCSDKDWTASLWIPVAVAFAYVCFWFKFSASNSPGIAWENRLDLIRKIKQSPQGSCCVDIHRRSHTYTARRYKPTNPGDTVAWVMRNIDLLR